MPSVEAVINLYHLLSESGTHLRQPVALEEQLMKDKRMGADVGKSMLQLLQVRTRLSSPSDKKKRKAYAFRRHFNEKPIIIMGCPVLLLTSEWMNFLSLYLSKCFPCLVSPLPAFVSALSVLQACTASSLSKLKSSLLVHFA